LIAAHESLIAFLALNNEGTLLATASDKGTLIRIYSTETGNFLSELRRGTEKAEIYSICFNSTSKFLACSSDRGTIHIFSLSTVNEKLGKEQK
jgi:WD40 repeat protein